MHASYFFCAVSPTAIGTSGNSVVEELDSIFLQCSFSANPRPLISWLKRAPDGLIRIVSSSRISVSLDYDNNTKLGVSMLTITDSVEQDAGVYICEANNIVPTVSVEAAEWNVTVEGIYIINIHTTIN